MKMDQQETAAFFLPTGHGDDDDNDNTCFTGVAKIFQRGESHFAKVRLLNRLSCHFCHLLQVVSLTLSPPGVSL